MRKFLVFHAVLTILATACAVGCGEANKPPMTPDIDLTAENEDGGAASPNLGDTP
ncbi:MAG TPA: hypothetical protein VM580_27155 [Labilithrix sp.]|nr:hypothetical protein [Labilithrix sp.]